MVPQNCQSTGHILSAASSLSLDDFAARFVPLLAGKHLEQGIKACMGAFSVATLEGSLETATIVLVHGHPSEYQYRLYPV